MEDTWYQCDRCTACCKWPGDVRVSSDEIEAIANLLDMDLDKFISQFTRLRTDRQGLSLIEKENHECVMLDGNSCKIQEAKPSQCRGFPNRWNFSGWEKICHAKPIPMSEARKKGYLQDES